MNVSDIVRRHPALAEVFEGVGIDYCCGGNRPLSDACAEQGMDVDTVVKLLNASAAVKASEHARVDEYPTDALIDHIVETHHAYLRHALPRLDTMVGKVAAGHRDDDPRLEQVKAVFDRLQAALLPHQDREEQELFPVLRDAAAAPDKETPAELIEALRNDHAAVGELLSQLRELTDDYTPQEWACPTTYAMLDGLAEL
jgi:regulator of cell morphogenesis and NO signaling